MTDSTQTVDSAETTVVKAQAAAAPSSALAMFGLLLVAYVLMSADRYLISILAPDIRKAISLDLKSMGALTTLFTLGIGVGGLPAGSLIARFSRKAVLLAGIVLFSGSTLLFTVAGGFFSMLLFVVLQGIGMAFLATSMFSLAASYFAARRVAAVGVVNVCFGLGSFVGPWLIGDIRSSSGDWHDPILTLGFAGLAIALLVALLVRPWFSEVKHAAHRVEDTGGADSLNNRNTLILTALSVIYGLAVYGFLGLYPTFLRESLHFTPAEAGAMIKFFGLGSLAAYFGGVLGDRLSPKLVIIASSIAVVILGFFLFLPDLGLGMRRLLVCLYGIFGAAILYTNLAGAHIKSLRRSLAARGSSMFVTTLYAGAAFGGLLMAWLASQFQWAGAGRIQISLLTLVGSLLALGLKPEQMSK